MSFWSTERIRDAHCGKSPLIEGYKSDRVIRSAYELSMGAQAAISREGPNNVFRLQEREAFCIPKGQFAVLLTEERVSVPSSVLAFISLKLSVKSRGLINVSGFHVDPGYKRRLKFWVYNAGNEDIHVLRGDPIFLIWFADLDQGSADLYEDKPAHDEITGEDLCRLHGTLASPATLAKQVEQLEHKIKAFEWIGGTAIVILVSLCIALATPLLDYIVKPVVDRFYHNDLPVAKPVVVLPADNAAITLPDSTARAIVADSVQGQIGDEDLDANQQPIPPRDLGTSSTANSVPASGDQGGSPAAPLLKPDKRGNP